MTPKTAATMTTKVQKVTLPPPYLSATQPVAALDPVQDLVRREKCGRLVLAVKGRLQGVANFCENGFCCDIAHIVYLPGGWL